MLSLQKINMLRDVIQGLRQIVWDRDKWQALVNVVPNLQVP